MKGMYSMKGKVGQRGKKDDKRTETVAVYICVILLSALQKYNANNMNR